MWIPNLASVNFEDLIYDTFEVQIIGSPSPVSVAPVCHHLLKLTYLDEYPMASPQAANRLSAEYVLMIPLSQAQFLVKRLRTRFTSYKFFQCLHLVLPTSLFKNSMSVTATFLWVHGIFCKDRKEHVCRVDLGREVAVIAGIIAAD